MMAHYNIDALKAPTKQKNCPESKADWTASIPKGTPATHAEFDSWIDNIRVVPETIWPPQVGHRVCWRFVKRVLEVEILQCGILSWQDPWLLHSQKSAGRHGNLRCSS